MALFLRSALKATNVLLLLVGAATTFYSLWMYVGYYKAMHATEAPPPPLVAAPPPPPAAGLHKLDDKPWFIYAFAAAGAFIVLTSGAGLCGAEYHNKMCLGLYNVMLGVMLTLQLVIAILVFTKSGFNRLPDDPTGREQKVYDLIKENLPVFKWGGLAVLILQLLSLVLSCALKRAVKSLSYDSDDDIDDYFERHYGRGRDRSSRRTPLLRRDEEGGRGAGAAGSPTRSPRTDTWSQRMREKYGLDTSEFSYNPDRTAGEGARSPGVGGSCAVM